MKNIKNFFIGSIFIFSISVHAGHHACGTDYTELGVKTYATMRHGIDGSLFLDPYLLPFFENIENLMLLDAGCGAGPWSFYAAQKGALVYGIDIQEGMIAEVYRPKYENFEAWQGNTIGLNRAYYQGYPFVIFHVQK